jgi:hypothetical protein
VKHHLLKSAAASVAEKRSLSNAKVERDQKTFAAALALKKNRDLASEKDRTSQRVKLEKETKQEQVIHVLVISF